MEKPRTDYKHGVSLTLVGLMNRFERGDVTKDQFLAVVDALQAVSVDETQNKFFDAIKELVDKVEKSIAGVDIGD